MKKFYIKLLPKLIGFYFNILSVFSKKNAAIKALSLFCTPRKGRVLENQKGFLEKALNDKIQIKDHNIQTYQWKGEGETILLLHGWESNSFRWYKLIGFLQEQNYNIIAFDAPAHGNSSGKKLHVPLFTACTNELVKKYNPSYIIGHSMGGMTTLYYQYLHKNKNIKKIVSLGAPAELKEITLDYQRLLGFNNRVLSSLDALFRKRFNFNIHEFSLPQFAKDIPTPVLLIHDKLDKIAPYSAAIKMNDKLPNSKLISTSGLGHSLHQDQVNKEIITFLKA